MMKITMQFVILMIILYIKKHIPSFCKAPMILIVRMKLNNRNF